MIYQLSIWILGKAEYVLVSSSPTVSSPEKDSQAPDGVLHSLGPQNYVNQPHRWTPVSNNFRGVCAGHQ